MASSARNSGGGAVSRSILVVDDDRDFRVSLRQLLVEEGFEVFTARDGQDALELLKRIPTPAVILLDFIMPQMNGRQFLAVRRKDERLREIPVIILSAVTREWAGALADADHVLSKPLDADQLLSLVASYCGGARQDQP